MISDRVAAFLVSRAELGRKIADQDAETRRLRALLLHETRQHDSARELAMAHMTDLEAERARTAYLTAALWRETNPSGFDGDFETNTKET